MDYGLRAAPQAAEADLSWYFPKWGAKGDPLSFPGSSADDYDDDDDGGGGGGGGDGDDDDDDDGGGGGGGDDDAPSVRHAEELARDERIRQELEELRAAREVARSAATWAAVAPAPPGKLIASTSPRAES